MRGSRRPSRAKPPSGEERKNQLDLFFDWAVETAKRAAASTAAAAVAAKDAASRKFEELWAAFDKRCLTICSLQAAMLVACSNRALTLLTVIVVIAAVLTALLLAMPWVATCSRSDRAARDANRLATVLLITSVISLSADIVVRGLPLPWPPQRANLPKVEPPLAAAPLEEKSLSERAQREAEAQATDEAARVTECLAKEATADRASKTFKWSEQNFNKCRAEYDKALLTLKSLDAYCAEERRRLDAAGRALHAAMARMCTTTGSTKKSR